MLIDGVFRVQDQIDDNLFQLVTIGTNHPQIGSLLKNYRSAADAGPAEHIG